MTEGAKEGAAGGGAPPGVTVHGVDVDDVGRCVHYGAPFDVVSIRLPCCGRYHACHACHEAVEDHPARRWPSGRFDEPAVLCGACRAELTVDEYLASPPSCPRCGAEFNPGCVAHHPLYFEV